MIADGWRNITNLPLETRNEATVCEARRNGLTRNDLLDEVDIFHLVFPNSTLDWLSSQFNANTPLKRSSQYTVTIKLEEMKTFSGMILWNCVNQSSSLESYLQKKNRLGLSRYRWERIVSSLDYDERFFFALMNCSFEEQVTLGGYGCLDETMWQWTGSDNLGGRT